MRQPCIWTPKHYPAAQGSTTTHINTWPYIATPGTMTTPATTKAAAARDHQRSRHPWETTWWAATQEAAAPQAVNAHDHQSRSHHMWPHEEQLPSNPPSKSCHPQQHEEQQPWDNPSRNCNEKWLYHDCLRNSCNQQLPPMKTWGDYANLVHVRSSHCPGMGNHHQVHQWRQRRHTTIHLDPLMRAKMGRLKNNPKRTEKV